MMMRSLAAPLALAPLALAASLILMASAGAQQTLPSEPTQPTDPIDSIAPIGPASAGSTASTVHVPTAHLDAAHLQQSLRRQGYYDVHGIQRDGSRYRAMAQKDGKPVELEIDARTGAVTPKPM